MSDFYDVPGTQEDVNEAIGKVESEIRDFINAKLSLLPVNGIGIDVTMSFDRVVGLTISYTVI
jgi:hypothetical protein